MNAPKLGIFAMLWQNDALTSPGAIDVNLVCFPHKIPLPLGVLTLLHRFLHLLVTKFHPLHHQTVMHHISLHLVHPLFHLDQIFISSLSSTFAYNITSTAASTNLSSSTPSQDPSTSSSAHSSESSSSTTPSTTPSTTLSTTPSTTTDTSSTSAFVPINCPPGFAQHDSTCRGEMESMF